MKGLHTHTAHFNDIPVFIIKEIHLMIRNMCPALQGFKMSDFATGIDFLVLEKAPNPEKIH